MKRGGWTAVPNAVLLDETLRDVDRATYAVLLALADDQWTVSISLNELGELLGKRGKTPGQHMPERLRRLAKAEHLEYESGKRTRRFNVYRLLTVPDLQRRSKTTDMNSRERLTGTVENDRGLKTQTETTRVRALGEVLPLRRAGER